VALSKLPASIDRLVFTASIDGAGVMGGIASCGITLSQNGKEAFRLDLAGKDFQNEKAVVMAGRKLRSPRIRSPRLRARSRLRNGLKRKSPRLSPWRSRSSAEIKRKGMI